MFSGRGLHAGTQIIVKEARGISLRLQAGTPRINENMYVHMFVQEFSLTFIIPYINDGLFEKV